MKLLTRLIAALAALLVCAFAAQASAPSSLRLHIQAAGVSSPGPGAADQTFSVQQSEAGWLDLSSAMALCNDDEEVAIGYTGLGAATLEIFPGNVLSQGVIETNWRKAWLTGNYGRVLLTVTGAPAETNYGRITTNCSGGTHVIQINTVPNAVAVWLGGAGTKIRYGGLNLNYVPNFAGSTPLNTTVTQVVNNLGVDITSTVSGSPFEVYNGRLMPRCLDNPTRCPADGAGAYTGTGATSAIPLANRVGDWTVSLQRTDTGATWTGIWRWVPNQYDTAPTPAWMSNTSGNSQFCITLIDGAGAIHRGDTIADEGSVAYPTSRATGACAASPTAGATRAYRVGTTAGNCGTPGFGPCDPINELSEGWITAFCRQPMQCNISNFGLNTGGLSLEGGVKKALLAFDGMDLRKPDGNQSISLTDSGAAKIFGIMFKFNRLNTIQVRGGAGQAPDQFQNIAAARNHISTQRTGPTANGIIVFGCDVRLFGNKVQEATGNGVFIGITNCVKGNDRSHIAANWITETHYWTNGDHPDDLQSAWSSLTLQPNTDYEGPKIYNNLIHPGVLRVVDCQYIYVTGGWHQYTGSPGCSGTQRANIPQDSGSLDYTPAMIGNRVVSDGQTMLQGNIPGFGDIRVRQQNVGNVLVTSFANGSASAWMAPGSMMDYNTVASPVPYAPFPFISTIPGYPASPGMSVNGLGGRTRMQANIVWNAISANPSLGVSPPTPDAGVGNITNAGSSPATYLADTSNLAGRNWSRPQQVISAYAPAAGATVGGQVFGAVGNGKFDFMGMRVLDPTVFDTTVGVNAPTCQTPETLTPDFVPGSAAVGGKITVTGAATFTNGGTLVTDKWYLVRVASNGAVYTNDRGSFPSQYTLSSSDLNAPGTWSAHHMVFAENAGVSGGSAACRTVVLLAVVP